MSEPTSHKYRRYASFAGSVLAAVGAGTNYAYSAYAPQLGQRLHISSTRLNIIGAAGNFGVYLSGPVWGRVVDIEGPRMPLLAACGLLLFGYLGIRFTYDRVLPIDPSTFGGMTLMVLFGFASGSGGNAGLTAGVNATAKSFRNHTRATATSIVLAGFGLSAFVFSTISAVLFPGETSFFLLTVALGTSLSMLVGFFCIKAMPPHQEVTQRDIEDMEGSELGETTEDEIVEDENEVLEEEPVASSSLLRPNRGSFELSPPRSMSPSNVTHRKHASRRRRRAEITKGVPEVPLVDIHGREMLTSVDFWMLFCILSCLSGTGLMWINNVGSVAQALWNYNHPGDSNGFAKLQAAQVSIISVFNCLGRVLIGVSSDVAHAHFGAKRSYLLTFVSLSFVISQLVASRIERATELWIASALLGVSYGAIFGLMPMVSLEWFGMGHFSQNWGVLSLSPLLAANVFNLFFGSTYDAHSRSVVPPDLTARAGGVADSSRQCFDGRLCYVDSLTLTTVACCIAFVLSLVAAWRDRQRSRREDGWERIEREEPRK